jgi:hypothetical protein
MTNLAEFIITPRSGLIHAPCGEHVAYLDQRPNLQQVNRAAAAHTCSQESR